MSKELKHRRDDRKKPALSLKEKRARKHEKQARKSVSGTSPVDDIILE